MNNNEDIMCEHKNYTRLEEFEPNCFTCVCLDCGEKFVKIINPITNMNNKQWEEEFYQKFGHIQIIKDDKNGNSYDRITDFISALLKEREVEIRKETIKEVLPEEKDMPVADENFFIGYNTCRELIKDKAKSKFNITI